MHQLQEHLSLQALSLAFSWGSKVALTSLGYRISCCIGGGRMCKLKLLENDSAISWKCLRSQLRSSDILRNPRLWKLILSVFSFSSTSEMIFGLYLLYYFRVFERQIGSNKYSNLSGGHARKFCGPESGAQLHDPLANLLTSGPYGLIFASFVPFYFDIPVSTRFQFHGVRFSDKSVIYLAGVLVKENTCAFHVWIDPILALVLQLLLSSWKRSILPGICGILAGSLYRLSLFGIRKAKFPEFIASFFSRHSWPSRPSTGSLRGETSRNVAGSAPSYAGRHRTHPAPMAPSTEPSEDAIATLASMGFDRNSARQALVQARNDVNTATNILLEAQSH
ncbi:hypothetical protein DKX38_009014 [Salix brachista]|uniref:UBA domain-containing protein n=1 Tax=Salix brachista TaxID=2182728 RepID=A0A5N5MBP4_9ROSI|nr:hypothetical protein DKX38_009014 [Salix brachista]